MVFALDLVSEHFNIPKIRKNLHIFEVMFFSSSNKILLTCVLNNVGGKGHIVAHFDLYIF